MQEQQRAWGGNRTDAKIFRWETTPRGARCRFVPTTSTVRRALERFGRYAKEADGAEDLLQVLGELIQCGIDDADTRPEAPIVVDVERDASGRFVVGIEEPARSERKSAPLGPERARHLAAARAVCDAFEVSAETGRVTALVRLARCG